MADRSMLWEIGEHGKVESEGDPMAGPGTSHWDVHQVREELQSRTGTLKKAAEAQEGLRKQFVRAQGQFCGRSRGYSSLMRQSHSGSA
jgi:hypothetical protein